MIAWALVLSAATGAQAKRTPEAQAAPAAQGAWATLTDHMPEPPFGALLFGAAGWWLLMRRRPQRDAELNG